jgi:hypothetical protein
MTDDQFWDIIKQAKLKAVGKSQSDHAQALIDEVAKLSIDEIVEYYLIHRQMMVRAYDPLLWAAAGIMAGGLGCGNDGFADFRSWLIAQGKEVYEAALAEPETLVDTIEIGIDAQAECFTFIAIHAYDKKTGSKDDFYDLIPDTAHLRDPWSKDLRSLSHEEASERFPKLYAKFWDQWKTWWRPKANPDETENQEREQNDD